MKRRTKTNFVYSRDAYLEWLRGRIRYLALRQLRDDLCILVPLEEGAELGRAVREMAIEFPDDLGAHGGGALDGLAEELSWEND